MFAFILLAFGCKSEDPTAKIGFDLEILNEDGLYGPRDGLRSLDYEFCIPAGQYARDEVMSIDPSAHCSSGKGRVDCGANEFLCIGNTHQERHKDILKSLADLRYVRRIEESFFE
jgi:hypothetical protein